MSQKSQIGKRVREWIGDMGWSKAEFARRVGIHPQNVNSYLDGKLDPTGLFVELQKLGADVEYLLTGNQRADHNTGFDPRIAPIPLLGKIVAEPLGEQYFVESPRKVSFPYFKGSYFALIIENDSLINAPDGDHSMELYPGDVAVFEENRRPRKGNIVAVELRQSRGRMVKILARKGRDSVDLSSANRFREYPAVKIRNTQIAAWAVFVTKVKLTKAELKRLGL